MPTVGEIFACIDALAPFASQMEFDNAGLLIGSRDDHIDRVLVCLDATDSVIAEAARLGCQLIVSHHPLIWTPLRRVPSESRVSRMIRSGLSLISAHTNLDVADGGVNDALAALLGLTDTSRCTDDMCGGEPPMGTQGTIQPAMKPEEFAAKVADSLGGAAIYTPGGRDISRVAVLGGAGADYVMPFIEAGFDAIVTGECKHHLLLEAESAGVTLITAGHYETEHPVVAVLAGLLRQAFPDAEIIESAAQSPTVGVLPAK